jgi:hypothetical protein
MSNGAFGIFSDQLNDQIFHPDEFTGGALISGLQG